MVTYKFYYLTNLMVGEFSSSAPLSQRIESIHPFVYHAEENVRSTSQNNSFIRKSDWIYHCNTGHQNTQFEKVKNLFFTVKIYPCLYCLTWRKRWDENNLFGMIPLKLSLFFFHFSLGPLVYSVLRVGEFSPLSPTVLSSQRNHLSKVDSSF